MIFEQSFFDSISLREELKLYKEMKNNDPIINTSIEILKTPLLSLKYDIITNNPELKDFLYETLEKLDLPLFVTNYFFMIDYGFVVFEKLYRLTKYGYQLAELGAIDSSLFYDIVYRDKFYLVFQGLNKNKRIEQIETPLDSVFIANYNKEFSECLGRSLLRPIKVYYLLKKNILQADARLRLRGAGIVIGGLAPELISNDSIRNNFENMLANIGNNKNGYGLYVLDKSKVEFIAPMQNNDNIEMLRYIDHAIFYNTQAQFLFAGIDNQNGGRANTREHRLVYVNKINSLLTQFEKDVNFLLKNALRYTKFINEEFEFQVYRVAELEAIEVASEVVKLGNLIKLRPQDEAWFRQAFGLPQIDIHEEIQQEEKEMKLSFTRKAQEVFEFNLIVNSLNLIENKTKLVLENWLKEVLIALSEKIKKKASLTKDEVLITKKQRESLLKVIFELYKEAVEKGRLIMTKEINKILKEIEFSIIFKDIKDKDILAIYLGKLADSLETNILTDLLNKQNVDYIDYEKYLLEKYSGAYAKLQDDIRALVANGVIDGRGEIIEEYEDKVKYYEYSAILDQNLCKECKPYDGKRKTLDEWLSLGFNLYSPINPNCEGGHKCRCVLIPLG